jgi:RHS repeat-associated protein
VFAFLVAARCANPVFSLPPYQFRQGQLRLATRPACAAQGHCAPPRRHSAYHQLTLCRLTRNLTSLNIPVNPGDQVTFGGWVYLESGGSSWQPGWWLGVRDANRIAINWISASPPASSGWAYQSGTFTVPSGAAYVWLYATVYQNTTTTAIRVDDGFLDVGTNYYVEDMLGTSRVGTTNTRVVCYDADFYPYGDERTYTNTCPQDYKFEGKERDTETGNDDFGARYYSNRFGRWLSADWSSVPSPVPYANLSNPQTLNLYAMVSDDSESFADLDGRYLNGADVPMNRSDYQSGDSYSASASAAAGMFSGNHCDDEENCQQPQNQQQAQAATTVTVLGTTVNLSYDPHMSAADRLAASDKIAAAVKAINDNAGKLSDAEKAHIANIKEINVDPKASRSSVDVKTGTLHDNAGQLGQGPARLATDLAHDSFHITQFKSGLAHTGGPAEHDATYFQIGVGGKFGLSQAEINTFRTPDIPLKSGQNWGFSRVGCGPKPVRFLSLQLQLPAG